MAQLIAQPQLMVGEGWDGYRLLDSGDGRKHESFGHYSFIRPEPQAMWSPRDASEWGWEAHSEFIPGADEDGGGRWTESASLPPEGWPLAWDDVRFTARPTPFRHLQFFPDMAPVWSWMRDQLGDRTDADTLNLFGYTGVGSLALSRHGRVTHVDASKKSVAQARENAVLSGMEDRPIRWLVDDAMKFAAREVRRGNRYDGIILDPPKFGRGPKNETWRIEEGLGELVGHCAALLDADSRFLFLTVYAVRMSSLSLGGLLEEKLRHLPGVIEHGDLAVKEVGERARMLPTAIFARWSIPG
ncbi:class I SAM-dependent methyltransferase [Altererythrobacter sp. CAU 1778]